MVTIMKFLLCPRPGLNLYLISLSRLVLQITLETLSSNYKPCLAFDFVPLPLPVFILIIVS